MPVHPDIQPRFCPDSARIEFPDVDLQDDELCKTWLLAHLHPEGLRCPHCGKCVEEARTFRKTVKSQLTVYRCTNCQGVYNLYSGTAFEGKHLRPAQIVLLLRGLCEDKPVIAIAGRIGVSRQTVYEVRKALEASAREAGQNILQASEDEVDRSKGEMVV